MTETPYISQLDIPNEIAPPSGAFRQLIEAAAVPVLVVGEQPT